MTTDSINENFPETTRVLKKKHFHAEEDSEEEPEEVD